MSPATRLALTRRLAAVAQDFRGAPMVHDLAAAIEELLQDPALLDGIAHTAAEQGHAGAGCTTAIPSWYDDRNKNLLPSCSSACHDRASLISW